MNRRFGHEQLHVYQLELEFMEWVTPLIDEIQLPKGRRLAEVCDHLDRASLSILLNTAEGNGKRQLRTRGRFFDDARGSACECAACLDALVAKRACPPERIVKGKELLYGVVSMLTSLVMRFAPEEGVAEDEAEYGQEDLECVEEDDDGQEWEE